MLIDTGEARVDISSDDVSLELQAMAQRLRTIRTADRIGWIQDVQERLLSLECILESAAITFKCPES